MKKTVLVCVLLITATLCAQKNSGRKDSLQYYFDNYKFLKALDYSEILYQRYEKEDNVPKMVSVALMRSNIYFRLGDSEKATEELYNALEEAESAKDKRSEIIVLREMGILLYNRVEFKMASKRFHRALEIAREIKNDSLEGELMQSLFSIHAEKLTDSAKYYLDRANAYKIAQKTPLGNYVAYSNSFTYYYKNEDLRTAEKYADSFMVEARKLKSEKKLADALANRAALYYTLKDYKTAKNLYDEMFSFREDTLSTEVGDYYYTYSGILAELGDYEKAYEYAEKSIELQDDTYGKEVNSSIRDLENRYDKQKEVKRRQRDLQIFSIIIALFLLSTILLYFFYQNSKLKQKNKLKEIESQTNQKLLSTTLDARETERKEIAAVLHDNISALLSSAGLQLTALSAQMGDNDEIAKTRKILREAHDKVRDLSHGLVPTLLGKFGLAYALEDLCEKFSTPDLQFSFTDDGSNERFNEALETKIYFVTSELLNNASKHSGASKVAVSLRASDELSIKVEDNGKGFDTTKPDGFGLTQIKARIASMQGKINVSSKVGTGTTIEITIPTETRKNES